jgi:hypothetical protein
MKRHDIFREERIDALRAQFIKNARGTDRSRVQGVARLLQAEGFSPEEVVALYVEATLHVDDLPPGFVPDLDAVMDIKASHDPHPLECVCLSCKPVDKPP